MGPRVKFSGFIIDCTGRSSPTIMPDAELLAAIRDFPEPTSTTELRSFIGMCTQLSEWNPDLSQSLVKMRVLLRKDMDWLFIQEIRKEFKKTKSNIKPRLPTPHSIQQETPYIPHHGCELLEWLRVHTATKRSR